MIDVYRKKTTNNSWYDYYLDDGNNKIGIMFLDNGDLYFHSFNNEKDTEFYITKENMVIYRLFDELFNDFKDARVFKVDEIELQCCESSEEINEKYESVNSRNLKLKSSPFYKQLFCDNTITWISDNSVYFDINKANSLIISKENNKLKLKFTYRENEVSYDRNIRITNSGSRYTPFNIIMMRFFNKLQEYDPEYHQIDIEEYTYVKQLKKD